MKFRHQVAATAVVVAIFAGWMLVRLGGEALTADFEDIVQTVAAFAAGVACTLSVRRRSGTQRLAWTLLSAATFSWGFSELMRASSLVSTAAEPPYPNASDIGYFIAVPLEVAAVIAFLTATTRVTSRSRALADGLTLSFCVLFVAWAAIYHRSELTPVATVISFIPPGGDVVTCTLLSLSLLRARRDGRTPYALLLAGFAALLVSDLGFAFLNVLGGYAASLLNTGWVLGFLLIGLAASSRRPAAVESPPEEGPIPMWQMLLTWVGLGAVMVTAAAVSVFHIPVDASLGYVGAAVGACLIGGQAVWYFDFKGLLNEAKAAQKSLSERTNLLQQIFNHAPLGIARANRDLVIIDVNPGLQTLLGEPRTSLVGGSALAYLEADAQPVLREKVRRVLEREAETVEDELSVRRGDGSHLWTRWITTPVRRPDGEVDYLLTMILDTDDKHRAEEVAQAYLAGLERLSRLKSEFVSVVSHEMRTALTGIQGFSEVMQTQAVTPDEVKEFAGDIYTDAARLNRMITEMLDLDRLESGRTTRRLGPVDLNELVRECVDRAAVLSTEHHVITQLADDLPIVSGDRDRLLQVVMNLVSNAIKYSPGGEIVITTRRIDGLVRVGVKDHGQGIPAEFIDRLFSRYERYEGTEQRVVGTGLGLAICRQIVEMHHGRIWAESKLGEGSLFQFEVPAAQSADGSIAGG